MSHTVQLTRIKNECLFISSTFNKENYQKIVSDPTLKRAFIGSLDIITHYMPKGVFARNIPYHGSPKALKNALKNTITHPDYVFRESDLVHFLEVRIPEILAAIKNLI